MFTFILLSDIFERDIFLHIIFDNTLFNKMELYKDKKDDFILMKEKRI